MKDSNFIKRQTLVELHEAMSIRLQDIDFLFAYAKGRGASEAALNDLKEAATRQPLSNRDFLSRSILVLKHLMMPPDTILAAICASPMPHLKLEFYEVVAYNRPVIVFATGEIPVADLHAIPPGVW